MAHTSDGRLSRDLGRWDLVALVINSIIGAGIFGLPSGAFALAGTYSVFAYVASAIALALVILCFAEVGSRFTATGGPYLYARTAFGPLVGFQVGWLLWIGRIAAAASLANLFVGYVGYFFPDVSADPWRTATLIAIFAALAAANIGGVRLTALVTNILTIGKLIPLVLLIVVGAFFVDARSLSLAVPPSYATFSQAALVLVFTYTGFEGATIPSGEMRHPERHLPFALLVGLGIVTLVYVAVQIVCIGTLPDLAHSERPLADAGLRFLGTPGASFIAAGALVSIGGVMNASIFATPRLLFAMGEHRQLPQVLCSTHPRLRTPIPAIILTTTVALGLALFSTFLSALTISAIVRLIAFASTCIALPVLRRRDEIAAATFVVPAGRLIAFGALGLTVWLLSNSSLSEMRLAVIAIAVGVVLYYACARLTRPQIVPQPSTPFGFAQGDVDRQ
jgi:amino acid transporter